MTTHKRGQTSRVEDRWHLTRTKSGGAPCTDPKHGKLGTLRCSAKHGIGKRWAARYVPPSGDGVERKFTTKAEAQAWLSQQTAAIATGTYVAPKDAGMTLRAWSDIWLAGYSRNRESSVRQARTHIKVIGEEFGDMPLSEIRPSMVKTWTAKLQEDYAPSTVHAIYRRLCHMLNDAAEDGYLGRNPCSRRTAPPTGRVERFCPTTEQVWQLHDAMPEHLRVAVLLGAFAGLRVAEAVALRIEDVDFMKGVVFPRIQWSADDTAAPLKTKGSSAPIPVPRELTLMLSESVRSFPGPTLVTNGRGDRVGPWIVERAIARVRDEHKLHDQLGFHTLRHYLASVLIAEGCDVKTVQARMRHSSATTTLTVYAHLWPDNDETTRTALGGVIAARVASSSGDGTGCERAGQP